MSRKYRCERCGSTFEPPPLPEGVHWHGATSLVDLLEEAPSLIRWPGNPRQGDVGAISESLRRFGQQKPVVVQEATRQIAAGNHLHDAVRALGWTHVAAVVSPFDDRDAQAFLIADNRTAELGTYDDESLGDFLRRLAQEGNLRGTGYDGDDVDDFLKGLAREDKVKPELAFSQELLESHNYVVLYFENDLDWNLAKTKLGIETVLAPDATETYDRKGQGRIIRGVDVIRSIPG
jgi:hypothetical protein